MPVARRFPAALPALALGAALALTAPPAAGDTGAEVAFMEESAALALEIASMPDGPARDEAVSALLRERFDLPVIARALLGRQWRSLDDAQRKAYTQAFRKHVNRLILAQIDVIGGTNLEVLRAARRDERNVIVYTRAQGEGEEPLLVDWRIRARDGRPRVIDVALEGVSLFTTMRDEFRSVVDSKGVAALIESLEAEPGGE